MHDVSYRIIARGTIRLEDDEEYSHKIAALFSQGQLLPLDLDIEVIETEESNLEVEDPQRIQVHAR